MHFSKKTNLNQHEAFLINDSSFPKTNYCTRLLRSTHKKCAVLHQVAWDPGSHKRGGREEWFRRAALSGGSGTDGGVFRFDVELSSVEGFEKVAQWF